MSLDVLDEHAISLGVPVAISLGVRDSHATSLGILKVNIVTRSVPDTLPGRRPLCNFVPDFAAHIEDISGDGSCLFHALSFGLRALVGAAPPTARVPEVRNANRLRETRTDWLKKIPRRRVSDLPMCDWVGFDNDGRSVASYCAQMRGPGVARGGGIEMAVYACPFGVAVHVYARP